LFIISIAGLVSCKPPTFEEAVRVEYYLDMDGDGYGDPKKPAGTFGFLSEEEMKTKRIRPIGRYNDGSGLITDEIDCNDSDPTVYPCSQADEGEGKNCGRSWPSCG